MWLVVFASLCFKYALSQESCSIVPSYQDACNRTISACVGRSSIELRCSANVRISGSRSIQWYNTFALSDDGTAPMVEPVADLQHRRIRVSTEGYWWCGVTDETLMTQQQRCTSVPALHLYQCICRDIDFGTFRGICPSTTKNLRCSRLLSTCRSSQTLLCLSTTMLSMHPVVMATETTPSATTKNPLLQPLKTKTPPPTKTASIPAQDEHSVTTATNVLLHPSFTLTTSDRGKDNEIRANPAGSSIVQLLTYIVGPVVALIAISIVIVLLTCVCCLRYKKNKLRGRRHSNSRSYSVGASWKEDHIYDTVILAKPSIGSPPTSRYLSQPNQSNNGVAAEYEIPVTRHGSDAGRTNGQTNGQSNHQQQQQSSTVNPVYLELYPELSTRNSDTSNTNNV